MNRIENGINSLSYDINFKKIVIITAIAIAAIALTALAILNSPLLIPATISVATLALVAYPAYRLAIVLIDSYKPAALLDSRPEPKGLPEDIDTPKKLNKPIPSDVLKQIKPAFLDAETLKRVESLRLLMERTKNVLKNSSDSDDENHAESMAGLYTSIKNTLDSFIVQFKLGPEEVRLVVAQIGLLPLLNQFSEHLANHPLKNEIDNLKEAFTKTAKNNKPESTSNSLVKTLTDRIANLTSYDDPRYCRIKASKYEALFASLSTLKVEWAKLVFKESNPDAIKLIKGIILNIEKVDTDRSSLEYLNDIRVAWESTVPILRELATLALKKDSAVTEDTRNLIYKACHQLYFKTNLHQENTNLLHAIMNDKNISLSSLKDIFKAYEGAPSSLTTHTIDRALKSLNDVFGNHFCPLNSGNPPQNMFEMGDIHVIGMGCPTFQEGYEIGKGQPAATVDPIFIASLHNLEGPHLYVSNQDHTSSEKVRNNPVMAIEHKNFLAVTINKNSKLYEGEGPDNAIEYKALLVKQFSLPIEESGCHIPKSIYPSSVTRNAILREIASNIHKTIFNNSEKLSKNDRRLFVSLFNALVILKIMKDHGIKSFNITCKDGIDRGMNSLAFLISLILIANDKLNTAESIEMLAEILFSRAYWARKREIKSDRFHRYHEDIEHLKSILKNRMKEFIELMNFYAENVELPSFTCKDR